MLKGLEKFEQNNNTIALNILYVPYNTKQIRPVYISEYNDKRDNQVILLMITTTIDDDDDDDNDDGFKNRHYVEVKSIPKLFRGITSNHVGDFYCLNCFHSYTTKKDLKSMKEYVKIMIFVMEKCLMKIIKF